ncbi:hypothetical protein PG987_008260 [Apiospora arundinis]
MEWSRLPVEIQEQVMSSLLDQAAADGFRIGSLASVNKWWQAAVECATFRHLKITPEDFHTFREVTGDQQARRRSSVRNLWLDLPREESWQNAPPPVLAQRINRNFYNNLFLTAVYVLFDILKDWEASVTSQRRGGSGLELEISNFLADVKIPFPGYDSDTIIRMCRMYRYSPMLLDWRRVDDEDQQIVASGVFDPVPAVTSFRVSRHPSKGFTTLALAVIMASFPNLKHLHLNKAHWEVWYTEERVIDEMQYWPNSLESISVRQGPSQLSPASREESARVPSQLAETFARRSVSMKEINAHGVFEALDFFQGCCEDPADSPAASSKLQVLTMTSDHMCPSGSDKFQLETLLTTAARAASRMPQLTLMELFSSDGRYGALFRYKKGRDSRATISWVGSWKYGLSEDVKIAWLAFAEIIRVNLIFVPEIYLDFKLDYVRHGLTE